MDKLIIQNIGKVLGDKIKGRTLYKVTTFNNTLNEPAYVFKFKEQLDGQGWNKEQKVHLMRVPKYNTNKYELFVMGLHGRTCIELDINDIKDIANVRYLIHKVLDTAHDWWLNVAS